VPRRNGAPSAAEGNVECRTGASVRSRCSRLTVSVLSRSGHDSSQLMCAKCLRDYWLDGFLCEPCRGYYAWLGPLLTAMAVIPLVLLVRSRVIGHERFAAQEAAVSPASGPKEPTQSGHPWDELPNVGGGGGGGGGSDVDGVARVAIAPRSSNEGAQSTSILVSFLQVGATLTLSTQFNSASSGESQDAGSTGSALTWMDQIISFRPWAPECAVGSWDYQTSTILLLFLPWLVVGVTATVALVGRRTQRLRRRSLTCCVLLLDLCVAGGWTGGRAGARADGRLASKAAHV
jgi:hypothetical protein